MKKTCCFLIFLATGFTCADDWPQWRGVNRDAHSAETGLLKEWPEGGPKIKWQVETVGVGYSSVSVSDGKIYTMGDLAGIEHIIALDEKTGKKLWAVQPDPVAQRLDQEVEEKFSQFDKDDDGKLSEIEALEGMGSRALDSDTPGDGDPAKIAADRAALYLSTWDSNGDGKLDPAEIPRRLDRKAGEIDSQSGGRTEINSIAKARAEMTLKALDKDGDEKISRDEANSNSFGRYFGNIDNNANKDQFVTVEEMQPVFAKGERGKDGLLTKDEIAGYFEKRYPGEDGILTKEDFKGSIGGYRNGMGDGPRGTPLVEGNMVYVEGGNGDVACLAAATGSTVWHVNLVADFGGGRPGWGYSESPLIVGDVMYVTPGGNQGTLLSLKKSDGSPVWQSEGTTQRAHYSSPVFAEIAGKKQIVQFGNKSTFGVAQDTGELLWEYSNAANGTANCSTPIVDGDLVLASSAYGTGGGVAKISNEGDGQKAEEVWFEKALQSHHGGLVKVGDHVYGFGSGGLICIDFKTGEIAWQDRSVGKGSVIYADGHLYCLGENHKVALVEATPTGYVEKGRFEIESRGRPSWAHPVIANGVLFIRDQHVLTAYDVKAN
ncbi:MAG: PQQ-binding-like beta-propeller repeat protein [Verrucomicrobiales bacterium]|nr:PQQ-binding-like beta-propeller repeat protein [Verrucomicrobiales bacterium]